MQTRFAVFCQPVRLSDTESIMNDRQDDCQAKAIPTAFTGITQAHDTKRTARAATCPLPTRSGESSTTHPRHPRARPSRSLHIAAPQPVYTSSSFIDFPKGEKGGSQHATGYKSM